jgi:2-polyprenyl-3-methyl-5-hydroxy-6-metoxy-1,4-benzoquinol methylase
MESITCILCGRNFKEKIKFNLKQNTITRGQFGYLVNPVICSCGLVYLSPRWSKEKYNMFYSKSYDELYRLEIKPDYGISGVIKNMEDILDRIKDEIEIKRFMSVLDVGCGYGYGLRTLGQQLSDAKLYGIESSPDCCNILQSEEIGAKLITTDFDSNWEHSNYNRFDVIIMRHVLEHMLDPVQGLKKVQASLSDRGIVYIAVPDMMNPKVKLRDYENWWEYWFRVVHTYYFCRDTLLETLNNAGLFAIKTIEENNEVWCVAMKGNKKNSKRFNNLFEEQKEVLIKHLA